MLIGQYLCYNETPCTSDYQEGCTVPAVNGRRVQALRKKLGLRQYELAIYAKVNQGYLSEIERNLTTTVGSQILVNLARVLETNVDYLLGTSDDPRPPRREKVGDLKPDEEELLKIYREIADTYFRQYVRDHARMMADTDRRLTQAQRAKNRKRREAKPTQQELPEGLRKGR